MKNSGIKNNFIPFFSESNLSTATLLGGNRETDLILRNSGKDQTSMHLVVMEAWNCNQYTCNTN